MAFAQIDLPQEAIKEAWRTGWEIGVLVSVLAFIAALIYLWIQKVSIPRQLKQEAREDMKAARELKFFDNLEKLSAEQVDAVKNIGSGINAIDGALVELQSEHKALVDEHKNPKPGNKFETVSLKRSAKIILLAVKVHLGDGHPELINAIDRALIEIERS